MSWSAFKRPEEGCDVKITLDVFFLLLLLQQIFRCIVTVLKNINSWTQCLDICNGALTLGCDFGGIHDCQDPENRYLISLKRKIVKFLKTNWSWFFSSLCCDWETLLRSDRSDVCCCWTRGDSQMFETLFRLLWTLLLDISTGLLTLIYRRLFEKVWIGYNSIIYIVLFLFDGVISIEWLCFVAVISLYCLEEFFFLSVKVAAFFILFVSLSSAL